MQGFLYLVGTILFTVYGQLILKWRLKRIGFLIPESFVKKLYAYFQLLIDPFIFSGFVSGFIASFFWMLTISKFELSKVYPFMSLSPVLVFIFGIIFLGEEFSWGKVIGLVLISVGLFVTVRY